MACPTAAPVLAGSGSRPRDELARLEAEQAQRNEEIKRKRLDLPWVRVEKEYEFDTR